MKKVCVFPFVLALVSLSQVQHTVQGEILASPGTDVSWLTVRLRTSDQSAYPLAARVESDGRFTVTGVPSGDYLLQLLDAEGNEIAAEPLRVSDVTPPVSLKLPERPSDRPAGRTVSVARLLHHPNREAVRAALKAQKLSRSGAYDRAAGELERAIALDPQFAEAHNNLGVQYMKLERWKQAAAEFRLAAALDPGSSQQQTNLAVALGRSGELEDAEAWARNAVRLDGANPAARSVLDSILAAKAARGKPETRDSGHTHSPRNGAQ